MTFLQIRDRVIWNELSTRTGGGGGGGGGGDTDGREGEGSYTSEASVTLEALDPYALLSGKTVDPYTLFYQVWTPPCVTTILYNSQTRPLVARAGHRYLPIPITELILCLSNFLASNTANSKL